MNIIKNTLIGASLALLTLSGQALAFNPQPDPPGKARLMRVLPASALTVRGGHGAGNGARFDADDNYCGTKVPGHIGPIVRGGLRGGGRFADADDNYCGTRVPGHGPIRYILIKQGLRNSHGDVMLNPQPLPPKERGRFGR